MSETVNLPELGESVTEGTVTRWLVDVGDEVEVDQPIVEISTDKVDTEVPSPAAGTVEELLVAEDEEVEVGSPLITIGEGASGSDDGGSGQSDAGSAEDESSETEPAEDGSSEDGASTDEAEEAEESAPAAESSESTDEAAEDAQSLAGGDAQEVTLPELGESVTEGTVTRWLVEVGDQIEVDQPIVEISTDKVDTEVPSSVAGTVQELKVSEDEEVEVGAVLALVGSGAPAGSAAASGDEPDQQTSSEEEEKPQAAEEEESEKEPAQPQRAESPRQSESAQQSGKTPAPARSEDSAEGYVTPLVRRLAKKEDIDLSSVQGTGVGGRIRKQDVQDAVEAKKSAPSAEPSSSAAPEPAPKVEVDTTKRGTTEKAPRIRQVIAQRMNESLDTSAQLTQVHEIDMTRIVNVRARAKESFKQANGVNLTYLAFIGVAVTEALKQHPVLNAEYDESSQEITYHDSEHLSFAVDTEKGLMVPVISDAGDLSLAGIAKKIADVAQRTRNNKISPEELSGGTFTITNLGSFDALFDTPIINQPQVAILGPGSIVKRPMVTTDDDGNDSISIRHMMYMSLTYDHRLVDGADAGRFLQTLKARLQEGRFEAELGL